MMTFSLVARVGTSRGPCFLTSYQVLFSRRSLSGASKIFRCRAKNNCRLHNMMTRENASRKIHNESNSTSSLTFRQHLGELRRNGIPEIVFGSMILALAGIDYVIRVRNDKPREDICQQLEREVRQDEMTTRKEERRLLDEGIAKTLKFKCIVRRVPRNFDGHKCLQNVKVGDVVDVIEEGVGPGGQYNLCMIESTANNSLKESSDDGSTFSIGWFPCSCLEKLE